MKILHYECILHYVNRGQCKCFCVGAFQNVCLQLCSEWCGVEGVVCNFSPAAAASRRPVRAVIDKTFRGGARISSLLSLASMHVSAIVQYHN